MESVNLQLSLIRASSQPRKIDGETVARLKKSLEQIGLMQPITVKRCVVSDGLAVDGFRIVAGHHRVEAAKSIGWDEIAAFVLDGGVGNLQAELMEIDDNLCRAELTTAQRTKAVKRRKQIWEALHPDEKRADMGGTSCPTHQSKDALGRAKSAQQEKSFAAETAAVSGQSKRDINRDLARADAIGDDDLDRVVGTCLDKGVELDALSKMPADERQDLICRAAAGEAVTARDTAKKEPKPAQRVASETLAEIRALADKDLSAFLSCVAATGISSAVTIYFGPSRVAA